MPEVKPCPACGSKSIEIDWDNGVHFMKCERCGVSGPCFIDEYPREFVADAWNALPRMSTIIAWQLQAAGAALALQRLMNAAQAMREAQQALENLIGVDDGTRMQAACKLGYVEEAFDDMLAGMLKDMGARNVQSA